MVQHLDGDAISHTAEDAMAKYLLITWTEYLQWVKFSSLILSYETIVFNVGYTVWKLMKIGSQQFSGLLWHLPTQTGNQLKMFPIVSRTEILLFVISILKYLKFLRKQRKIERTLDPRLLLAVQRWQNYVLNFMQVLQIVRKYISHKRKKKYLSKPHLLIQLMQGYACDRQTGNVWDKLQTNWLHFFWLTGETPRTLQQLVHELQAKFQPYVTQGRKSILDFRNQVYFSFFIPEMLFIKFIIPFCITYKITQHFKSRYSCVWFGWGGTQLWLTWAVNLVFLSVVFTR